MTIMRNIVIVYGMKMAISGSKSVRITHLKQKFHIMILMIQMYGITLPEYMMELMSGCMLTE